MLVPFWLALQALAAGENCPASVDVEARVRTILHLTPEQTISESFLVERHESGLFVELRGADTTVIGQRTLPANGSCDELAQAAAVVLAAWLSDVHPDFAGALPPPPAPASEPEPQSDEKAEPAGANAGVSAAHADADKDKQQSKPPPPPPPASPRLHYVWDVALGAGADHSASELALAGIIGVGLLPTSSGLGVSLLGVPTASRQRSLGPGTFGWRRWPLGIGPTLRLAGASLALDVSGGPALAWLHFSGSLFDRTFKPNGVAWGGFLSARAETRGAHWGALAWCEAQYYPAESSVYASGVEQRWVLPALSLGAFVGARYTP